MNSSDEYLLLGTALLSAQRLEFALYGIVSHLSHLPEARKEKRFRELTPEKFLRGDVDDLKATFGQILTTFGDTLLIRNEDLNQFIDNRNLIVHNYWRLTQTSIRGTEKLNDPEGFLKKFISDSDKWTTIIKGLLYKLIEAAAEKEGRSSEITFNEQQLTDINNYLNHASANLIIQAILQTK